MTAEQGRAFRRKRSRRAARVWNALTCGLWPLVAIYTWSRTRGKNPKSREWLSQAWGSVPSWDRGKRWEWRPQEEVKPVKPRDHYPNGIVWLHAVSVGETQAAREVARALRNELQCRIVVSSTTETGHQTALGLERDGLCDAAIYFPVDVPFAVRRSLQAVAPDVVVVLETELWPTFLHEAQRFGARVVLANGRVSDNLLKTAKRVAPLYRWMLGNLDAVLMRSDFDAARMRQLPAPTNFASRVQTVGDVKLDRADGAERDETAREKWRETLGIASNAPFWVAGSTHPGEEELVLDAFATLHEEFRDLRLLLAPRHIERAPEVESLLLARGFSHSRRSQPQRTSDAILLLDTVGELAQIYAACDVAFVGGSLIQRGGHNLLEPVLVGAPVVFGPSVQNFREAAQLATQFELGTQVEGAEELAEAVAFWLRNSSREELLQRANRALAPHRGAATRVAQVVAELVK